MHDHDRHEDERHTKRWDRLRDAALLACGLVSVALLAAACGSGSANPGVASAGPSSTTAAPSSGGSSPGGVLAYSHCMRAHGISDFPDPNGGGGLAIQNKPGSDLDPNNPQYQAANNSCQSLMPALHPSPAQQSQLSAEALKYSQCMRAHGISDFPDPNSQGQIMLGKPGQSVGDLDPSNPQFQSAATACQQYQPGGGQSVGGSQGNGGS